MFRVDAHHHVWNLEVRDQPWIDEESPLRRSFGVEDLAAAASGFDATVLVQTVTVAEETPELLALAAEHDLIAGVVGWVDLTAPDVADALAALGRDWLVGIRHQVQGEPDPRWLCREDVRRGLRAVRDAGLVYDLLTLPPQLPAALETVRALDDLVFVVDHLSKPPIERGELEPWATHMRELARCENVACKLSGLVTEADWDDWTVDDLRPYAETVLEAFGPERVMFGSDWPVCTLAASYDEVVAAAETLVPLGDRPAVFGETCRRIYTLGRRAV
ncbi:amidohydrolase family protein [Solirubrobacter phytolaccae]|uniref:Amidohydrolase family protein n=1 Tax=Solirubrobacter phytolaccae TaxID=1404360 RepID=A0A9X3SBR5_9ACTN|nr:amidohydrolase family protein [Solirubrobacter phytolaccae]MDA0184923.1 amidohydrolase family protein [Solirubrobacter phytolaccae]